MKFKPFKSSKLLPALCPALALAGCASGESGTETALTLPKMPELTSALPAAGAAGSSTGSATELYTRIARGAVGCWFGAAGGMKKDYIYHAEADAPSRGGRAEITIHVRDNTQPNPRGAKAYKIQIEPKDEANATVKTENVKFPEETAAALTADVNRWAAGEQGCNGASTAAGWSENNAKAAAATPPAAKSAGAKAGTKKPPAAKP